MLWPTPRGSTATRSNRLPTGNCETNPNRIAYRSCSMLDPPAPLLSSRLPIRRAGSSALRRISDREISPVRGRDQSTGTRMVPQSMPLKSGSAQGCQAIGAGFGLRAEAGADAAAAVAAGMGASTAVASAAATNLTAIMTRPLGSE
ncbi:hypothetical protein [Crossiella sp. CA198]|uniref:hypothetical protein n=1 Tax=Crossiella sp. CA198 TaxID=3455607 RepID=UPI003F8D823E